MAKLTWDDIGTRRYRIGVSHGVLYFPDILNRYGYGVAWNGLTSVSIENSGAEPSNLHADNSKYASFRGLENVEGTIEAYTYPDELELCIGNKRMSRGVRVSQQDRKRFGMCWRTEVGSDSSVAGSDDAHYVLHLMYGVTVGPTKLQYKTHSNSPEAALFSWDYNTQPMASEGFSPTSMVTIDSSKIDPEYLGQIEAILYGTGTTSPRLPTPDELAGIVPFEPDPGEELIEVTVQSHTSDYEVTASEYGAYGFGKVKVLAVGETPSDVYWYGTEAEYEALPSYREGYLYLIMEDD